MKVTQDDTYSEHRPLSITKSDTLFLYSSVVTAELLLVATGSSMVWPSPVLGKLASNDTATNPIGRQITTVEISMLTGIPQFTNILGLLFCPKLSDVIGRKRYLLLAGIGMLISGVALAFSDRILYMILCRCIFGFFGVMSVVPVYVAEICEDRNRGKFGCYTGMLHQIGHLFGFVVGPFLSVRYFTLVVTAPLLVFITAFPLMPETPVYLLKHGRITECKASLKKLRRNKNDDELELDLRRLEERLRNEPEGDVLSLLKKREHLFGLLLSLLPVMLRYSSGVTVLFTFLAPFFDSAKTGISGDLVAIIIAIAKICFFLLTSLVVDRFGRRKMLLVSSCSTAVPLFALGIYFYLHHVQSPVVEYLQWLPFTGLLATVCCFGLGVGPIPTYLMTEFFPANLRTVSGSIVNSSGNVMSFVLTFLFPIVSEELGTEWCVWFFSANCLVGAVLIYLFLPETKGKNYSDVQKVLKR
ncbi:unnamed protein product [Phyllotreta striolata]|uniref:Major facilitator superfamily (MFS) profile domain-containing protein n=1 Tax=Phyllotreta striolata TaxID=444603 RepID=A0A9N9TT16_PHYSR|nr:unnamed protein product [Phyllotreta striolata]